MIIIQSIIIIIIIISRIIFCHLNHPLSIGLILLIQTILASLFIGLIHQSFWFSYTLFLIFIGGILVLFIYITSLASNEIFFFSKYYLIIFLLLFFILINVIIIIDKSLLTIIYNLDISSFLNKYIIINENIINLNKIYNFPTNYVSLLLINYLFFTLIVVVKISKIYHGPLRIMN